MVEARPHLESLRGSLVELSRNKIVDRREYSNRQQPATTSSTAAAPASTAASVEVESEGRESLVENRLVL
jgi:hypothetical protein